MKYFIKAFLLYLFLMLTLFYHSDSIVNGNSEVKVKYEYQQF